jgi:hypothetical protein
VDGTVAVTDNGGSLTVDGTVELGATSLSALENMQVTFPSTQNVSVQNTSLAVTDNGGSLTVDGPLTNSELRASVVPVSVSGVSTEANQVTANSSLNSIDGKLPALSSGRVPVDIGGSGSITITSGTITVSNEVEVKNDSSNPLPVSGTISSNTRDGSGNAITSTTQGSTRRLDVMLSSGGATGSTAPTDANLMGGTDGTNLRGLSVDSSGRLNVNVNGTVPVSGTVTANTGLSQPLTDTQLRATAVPVSGTVIANNQALTTGTGSISGTSVVGTDLIASTDVSGFAEASIQFSGTWPINAYVTPQLSNDNSTWFSTTVLTVSNTSPTVTNSFSATQLSSLCRVGLFGARYFRLRITTVGTSSTYNFAYTLNPRSTNTNVQSVSVANTPSVNSTPVGGSAAGASIGTFSNYLTISAAGTNATNIRTVQCVLYMCNVTNLTSSFKYLKLFNTSIAITVGTSTPTFTIPIPPNSTIPFDCGGVGLRFTNGLAFSITGGLATSDTTAITAGDVVVNIAYV